tara:strand:- start:666 stop:884 length:219 start_codon:yes stop_codon:yes gene_type:complete
MLPTLLRLVGKNVDFFQATLFITPSRLRFLSLASVKTAPKQRRFFLRAIHDAFFLKGELIDPHRKSGSYSLD